MNSRQLPDLLRELDRSIAESPDDALAHARRALVLGRLGRPDEALAAYDAALERQPEFVDCWFNKANLLRRSGRLEEALACYRRVAELAEDDAAALNNMGITLFQLGRGQEALDCYARAIALRPDYAEAFTNRGNALLDLGYHDEAIASHERSLAIDPGHIQARVNLGNVRQELGAHEDALREYQRALAADPACAEAHNGAAVCLQAMGQLEPALAAAERALACAPGLLEAMGNKGRILAALGREAEALDVQRQAHSLEPGATQCFDVAVALQRLDRHEEALGYFETALVDRPDYVEALVNRGNSLQALNRHAAAVRSYQRALEVSPRDADAHWNEALARLALGDYKGGWPKYEWRWRSKLADTMRPPVEAPVWSGSEPLEGARVLLFHEQGFGDAIQFVRFAGEVAKRAGEVVVACHRDLRRLFATAPGVAAATDDPAALHPDFQVSLMSLPAALRTTLRRLPAQPYLSADVDEAGQWRERLAALPARRKVGFVWAGNPRFPGAAQKRLPLAALEPLLGLPGIAWISLQKVAAEAERQRLGSGPGLILDVASELADFAATAACIDALDLVITVDTAVAHLAGALGKPVWILLPFSADWRWLVGRDDSPWYPSARLFRQQHAGRWEDVIDSVRSALEVECA